MALLTHSFFLLPLDTLIPYLNLTTVVNVTVGEELSLTILATDPNTNPGEVDVRFVGTLNDGDYTLTEDDSSPGASTFVFSWTPSSSSPYIIRYGNLPGSRELDLMKSRSREICSLNHRIALKFDRHIHSGAAEVPVKFKRDRTILNTNLAASRLHEILQYDVLSDNVTGPWIIKEI